MCGPEPTTLSSYKPPMTFIHKENEWKFEC